MNRFPVLTGILAALAQLLGPGALAITVLPWFLGPHVALPLASFASVLLGLAAGHLGAHLRTADNAALLIAAVAVAAADAAATLVLHAGLGTAVAWGIAGLVSALFAMLIDHAPLPDLVRRHLVLAAVLGAFAVLLGALGSPYGGLAGDLGLLSIPTVIIAYAAVHSAERTGRPASRESLIAAIGLAALAIVLVTPVVRTLLSDVVQGILFLIVTIVTYGIFYPLSGLISDLLRLLKRHQHQPPSKENLSDLARNHQGKVAHIAQHPFGPSAAFWAILLLVLAAALVIWLIGRGRRPEETREPDYREEVRPLSRARPPRPHAALPPPGIRRQYAEALGLLHRSGLLPMGPRIGHTPRELAQDLERHPAVSRTAPSDRADDVSTAHRAFLSLSELYSHAMYGPPDPRTDASGPDGAPFVTSLRRLLRSVRPDHVNPRRRPRRTPRP